MILRVYAHLTDRQEQRATEKLRAFMAGEKKKKPPVETGGKFGQECPVETIG